QRLAGGLTRRGIKQNDRVLIHLDNCPEALLLRFACAWIGAVCVATNTTATGDELTYLVRSSGVVCAITQGRYTDVVAAAGDTLQWVAVLDATNTQSASLSSFDFSFLPDASVPPRPVPVDHVASIMFTTGSTARPKGVAWTHENVLWAAAVNAR